MAKTRAVPVGVRGGITLPPEIRREMNLEPGSLLLVEPTPEGILLRPAAIYPIEKYTQERLAEFQQEDAATPAELRRLRKRARA